MLLSMKGVTAHYGQSIAIRDVSLEVETGKIVTLIGSNGAGKTTILRVISGLKAITSGEIWFQGTRINGLPPEDMVKLGIAHAPEGRRLFPYMTVLENLKMGAFLRKDKNEIQKSLEEVLEHFTVLKEKLQQQAGTLSGGEQQMVTIGRALMVKPKLLLMDEPSLGLSPVLVREIAKIIRAINAAGVSIMLVEQNAHLALRIAHKAYVLQAGKIILEGDAVDLLNNEKVKEAFLGS